jgi:predicted ATPase/DNA-binding winged helix-turn-helix (wHTH) protein
MFYDAAEASETVLAFNSFRFFPARRMLYEQDRLLRLGSRAIDILHVLLERAGETVTKDQLIARAWPDTVVEEGNLRVHVAALRKTLGERHIENVVGRGYCFITPVVREEGVAPPAAPGHDAAAPAGAAAGYSSALSGGVAGGMGAGTWLPEFSARSASNNEVIGFSGARPGLPLRTARMVGRERAVAALDAQLAVRRFVSIVGTGGMGKTTVALALAAQWHAATGQGVCFVDLAPLTQTHQVPLALAAALGMGLDAGDAADACAVTAAIAAGLRNQRLLLIFDSCEHLLESVSLLAELVLHGAPGVSVLATSREPLRAEGEWVHRLPALELPPEGGSLSLEDAMAYPSVQLFAERVLASAAGLTLGHGDVPLIAEICRRLDGIPLAIELAAARVELFGVRGLVARLDDACYLLKGGRRTAKVRHRTLEATLDWSYALLDEKERAMLRRLSLFRQSFSLEQALELGADLDADCGDKLEQGMEALSNLVSKSLLATTAEGGVAHYRMLDTTRSYAAAKLAESGEQDVFAARYALMRASR